MVTFGQRDTKIIRTKNNLSNRKDHNSQIHYFTNTSVTSTSRIGTIIAKRATGIERKVNRDAEVFSRWQLEISNAAAVQSISDRLRRMQKARLVPKPASWCRRGRRTTMRSSRACKQATHVEQSSTSARRAVRGFKLSFGGFAGFLWSVLWAESEVLKSCVNVGFAFFVWMSLNFLIEINSCWVFFWK